MTKYRDNNNFLRTNLGEHNDERFNLFMPDTSYSFVDLILGPVWIGKNKETYLNRSKDGGQTFESNVYVNQMFGAYFFVSEDIVIHT